MTATVISTANIGYEGRLIHIECDCSNSLPGLVIVGLGNKAIEESKERIRSAIKNSGLEVPKKRITLNLAPADLPKDGSSYDLPMALAILVVSGALTPSELSESMFVGELALDGSIRPVRGIIGHLETAKLAGLKKAFIPRQNLEQASLVPGLTVYGVTHLREVGMHLTQQEVLQPFESSGFEYDALAYSPTLDDVYEQAQAKRALIIAAAGRHNILLDGPPGSGKTMLAKALLSILPQASTEEILAITKLHSLAGMADNQIIVTRPFRNPHHTASSVALTGGGRFPKPGEISLAHHGILFLDELPEYPRAALEALRQPLEDRTISIARVHERITYPADFMLVATKNPCPCGYFGDETKECICSMSQVLQYKKRISGPLLDRIDLLVRVDRVKQDRLLTPKSATCLDIFRAQIARARQRQLNRFGDSTRANTHLTQHNLVAVARLAAESKSLLDRAATKLDLSARVYMKMIKLARTIADLEDSDNIEPPHIAEALQYRQL